MGKLLARGDCGGPPVQRPCVQAAPSCAGLYDNDHYWQSETYKRAICTDELRSVCCCLITNLGYFVWQLHSPAPLFRIRLAILPFVVVTGVLQYGWFWFAPSSFLKHRTSVRVFNRVVRCSTMLALPLIIRCGIRRWGTLPFGEVLAEKASMRTFVPFSLKHLLMFSGANAHMAIGLHTTLPLPSQLAVHAACTLALIATHSASLAFVMRAATSYSQEFYGACTFLNMLLALTQGDLENSAGLSAHLDSSCREHAEELLGLFVMIYAGLVMPVYVAARIDAHRRRQYLLELMLQQSLLAVGSKEEVQETVFLDEDGLPLLELEVGGSGLLGGVLFDAAMAAVMAVLTWGVVAYARRWIVMLAWPL